MKFETTDKMVHTNDSIETRREELQHALDAQKTQKQRNMMGQFATPFPLACDIMKLMCSLGHTDAPVTMLEPSAGLGAFISAFRKVYGIKAGHTLGFEIDDHYYTPSKELWRGCDVELRCADFLEQSPDNAVDMIVANPPYVRHHHIAADVKQRLKNDIKNYSGISISGLAGLYCYFMILSTRWLCHDGLSCWLVPCEFMEVNYGSAVKQFLLTNVRLVRIHRFVASDLQFADALVSSCVVVFRNAKPSPEDSVVFSEGGMVSAPDRQWTVTTSTLTADEKWTCRFGGSENTISNRNSESLVRLGDFFTVKRGIATGDNRFFVIDCDTAVKYSIPKQFLVPILPSPRFFKSDSVRNCSDGLPDTSRRLYLFTCSLDEQTLKTRFPSVWKYVQQGLGRKVNEGYICSRRTPWYSCERREPAPFVMPYMGRGEASKQMFRFIMNETEAVTTNVYLLLYPKKNYAKSMASRDVREKVWKVLNSISKSRLMDYGRVYGGGLYKMEPKELMNMPVPEMAEVLQPKKEAVQLSLF